MTTEHNKNSNNTSSNNNQENKIKESVFLTRVDSYTTTNTNDSNSRNGCSISAQSVEREDLLKRGGSDSECNKEVGNNLEDVVGQMLNSLEISSSQVSKSRKEQDKVRQVQQSAAAAEETFEQFEERIESHLYNVRKEMREGQRDCELLSSQLRTLQFSIYAENQKTSALIRAEIEALCTQLRHSIQETTSEIGLSRVQVQQIARENKQDQYFVRQLGVKEEILSRVVGTDNDYFEVIPGYVESWKKEKRSKNDEK